MRVYNNQNQNMQLTTEVEQISNFFAAHPWIKKLFWYPVILPLKILYLDGYWEGKNAEDICSYITKVDSSFWVMHEESYKACMILIDKKFYGFVSTLFVVLYFFVIYKSIKRILIWRL